jgi:hypothetical protein
MLQVVFVVPLCHYNEKTFIICIFGELLGPPDHSSHHYQLPCVTSPSTLSPSYKIKMIFESILCNFHIYVDVRNLFLRKLHMYVTCIKQSHVHVHANFKISFPTQKYTKSKKLADKNEEEEEITYLVQAVLDSELCCTSYHSLKFER